MKLRYCMPVMLIALGAFQFQSTETTAREAVEEVIYDYREELPRTPYKMDPLVDSEQDSVIEKSTRFVLRSMMTGDYDGWIESFDPESADLIRRGETEGRHPMKKTDWELAWTRLFGSGTEVWYCGCAVTNEMVVVAVEYRRPSAKNEIGQPGIDFDWKDGVMRGRLIFKVKHEPEENEPKTAEGYRLLQCLTFSDSPIILTWRTGVNSVRRSATALERMRKSHPLLK